MPGDSDSVNRNGGPGMDAAYPEAAAKPLRDRVGSLQRGLAVLEVLAAHPAGVTLSQVAEIAGLTRAGARRLLLTLVAEGFATLDGRRFQLSPKLLTLVRTWLQG